jgi:hypothetical protein
MLIRVPSSWPHGLVAVLAMLVLAALDLAGAFAAKEAVARRSVPFAAAGVVLFVVLFWVYASSLRYADLAPVTFGWIVVLQVGVLLLDRLRYQTPISRGQWVAVAVLIAAQAYLLVGARAAPAATTEAAAANGTVVGANGTVAGANGTGADAGRSPDVVIDLQGDGLVVPAGAAGVPSPVGHRAVRPGSHPPVRHSRKGHAVPARRSAGHPFVDEIAAVPQDGPAAP